jgi:hypothetical protein
MCKDILFKEATPLFLSLIYSYFCLTIFLSPSFSLSLFLSFSLSLSLYLSVSLYEVDTPVGSSEGTATATAPAPLKSIEAYNIANPEAASAASSAVKTLARKSTRLADGTARCQRKGCQKNFIVEKNEDLACRYHKGNPIFHDALKFWSCCPNKKCLDFDDFLAVPGCANGWHDDGVIELVDNIA